jgi:pimeloyl-ACP methyl ester carboxylesterase
MRPHNPGIPGALVVIVIGCLVLSGCAALQTATPASPLIEAAPQITLEPCTLAGGVAAQCGTLSVPENRVTGAGRTIDLHVAVLKATGPAPAADAVFFLSGGPGGVASVDFAWTADALFGLNRNRDFVLVDQRGVGASNALTCPDPGFAVTDALKPEGAPRLEAYVADCLKDLPGDPAFYTSAMAAADLDAVRAALGYTQVNLYGGSYGATLAQYYALAYPDRVRTLYLEGASLLGIHLRERWPLTRQAALEHLFTLCAADAQCNARYPDLQTAFETVLARVSDRPVTTSVAMPDGAPVVIDRLALYLLTNGMLLSTDGQRALPALIYAAYAGDDYTPLAGVYRDVAQQAAQSLVQVMQWSIYCNEDWAQNDVAAVAEAAQDTYFAAESVQEAQAFAVACRQIPPGPQPADAATRFATAAPTIFRVGAIDPQDPIDHIATREQDTPNHLVLAFPGEAHAVSAQTNVCRYSALTMLVSSGSLEGIDTVCATGHQPPPFR